VVFLDLAINFSADSMTENKNSANDFEKYFFISLDFVIFLRNIPD